MTFFSQTSQSNLLASTNHTGATGNSKSGARLINKGVYSLDDLASPEASIRERLDTIDLASDASSIHDSGDDQGDTTIRRYTYR